MVTFGAVVEEDGFVLRFGSSLSIFLFLSCVSSFT